MFGEVTKYRESNGCDSWLPTKPSVAFRGSSRDLFRQLEITRREREARTVWAMGVPSLHVRRMTHVRSSFRFG